MSILRDYINIEVSESVCFIITWYINVHYCHRIRITVISVKVLPYFTFLEITQNTRNYWNFLLHVQNSPYLRTPHRIFHVFRVTLSRLLIMFQYFRIYSVIYIVRKFRVFLEFPVLIISYLTSAATFDFIVSINHQRLINKTTIIMTDVYTKLKYLKWRVMQPMLSLYIAW